MFKNQYFVKKNKSFKYTDSVYIWEMETVESTLFFLGFSYKRDWILSEQGLGK